MTAINEGRHTASFILSEASGSRSREEGTLAMGQDLAAGTVLKSVGGELTAYETASDAEVAVGILLAATDATDAAKKVTYIARDAEVNLKLLTYPAGTDEELETIEALAAIGIIARDE